MSNLCIIPARGGSKRIPHKNTQPFLGKPIMAYSIEAALTSGLFDEVMVSTDSPDIAAVALQYGAKVPFLRTAQTANDTATTIAVLKEVEATYLATFNRRFDYICCLYPTAPLVPTSHLQEGYQTLIDNDYDTVYPLVPFGYPIWRAVRINEAGNTRMLWPEHLQARSQDLETTYHDAGQWYWYNPQRVEASLLTDKTGAIVLSEETVQDIDNPSDWIMAEMKYERLHRPH